MTSGKVPSPFLSFSILWLSDLIDCVDGTSGKVPPPFLSLISKFGYLFINYNKSVETLVSNSKSKKPSISA